MSGNVVTFEDAVATLQSMFPDWQQQDLEAMLISNRNHVENTIDAIFQMDGPPRPKAPTPRSTPVRRQSEDYSQSQQRTPPPQRQGSFQGSFQVPAGNGRETYRGRRVQLPDDFLAAPEDFVREEAMYDDEQLSVLLQNEMFQREVALTLGRQNPLTYAGTLPQRSSIITPPHGSPSVNIQGRKYNAPSVPGSAAGVGDIKMKLANMGAAAKRNLNNLAISFSRRARQNPNALNAPIRDERETSSLMNYFEDKPDENTDEIITFEQRNPAAPVLPRGAPRHALEADPVAPGSAMFRKAR